MTTPAWNALIRAMFSQSNIKAGIEILGRAQEGKKA